MGLTASFNTRGILIKAVCGCAPKAGVAEVCDIKASNFQKAIRFIGIVVCRGLGQTCGVDITQCVDKITLPEADADMADCSWPFIIGSGAENQ